MFKSNKKMATVHFKQHLRHKQETVLKQQYQTMLNEPVEDLFFTLPSIYE